MVSQEQRLPFRFFVYGWLGFLAKDKCESQLGQFTSVTSCTAARNESWKRDSLMLFGWWDMRQDEVWFFRKCNALPSNVYIYIISCFHTIIIIILMIIVILHAQHKNRKYLQMCNMYLYKYIYIRCFRVEKRERERVFVQSNSMHIRIQYTFVCVCSMRYSVTCSEYSWFLYVCIIYIFIYDICTRYCVYLVYIYIFVYTEREWYL